SGLSTKITFANLPRQFAAGAYSVDRYLVDETHSNYMHDNANDKLQKIGSEKVAAGSSYSTTVTFGANAVIMFVLTPVPPASARSRPDRGVLLGEGVRLDAKTQIETSGAKAVVEPDGQSVSVVFPAAKGEQWLAIKPPVGRWDLSLATEVHVKLKNVGTAPITPSVQVASVRGPTDTVAPGPLAVGEEREIVVSFIPALPGRGEPVARPASPGDQRQAEYTFNSDAAGPVLITARHDGEAALRVESITAAAPPAVIPEWLGNRPPVAGEWVKTFDEEFDGPSIDQTRWNVYGPNYWDRATHWTKDDLILEGGIAKLR